MYELFAQRPAHVHLVVPACQNPQVEQAARQDAKLLFELIDEQPEQGRITLEVPAAPGRSARTAELAVRFVSTLLRRPLHGADPALPEALPVTLVEVGERAPPADGSKPIRWRLLTTHAVTNLTQAQHVVDLYRLRWTIEEFFSTLKKAGFDIEAADIGEPQAMINFVAAAVIAAVTIKQLVQARDGVTAQSLTDAFEPDDQPILEAVSARLGGKTDPPARSPSQGIAGLRRLGDRPPRRVDRLLRKARPKVMRIGLTEFRAIKYGTTLVTHDV